MNIFVNVSSLFRTSRVLPKGCMIQLFFSTLTLMIAIIHLGFNGDFVAKQLVGTGYCQGIYLSICMVESFNCHLTLEMCNLVFGHMHCTCTYCFGEVYIDINGTSNLAGRYAYIYFLTC